MYFSIHSPTLASNEHAFAGACLVKQLSVRTEKIMSFFSEAEHKFLPIPEDSRIETKSFLDAASEIVPFFGE